MGVLAEYLKSEAENIKQERAKTQEAWQDWLAALNGLFKQLEAWLDECDPEGLINRRNEFTPSRDIAFINQLVPMLSLELLSRTIQFIPRARNMMATALLPGRDQPERVRGGVEVTNLGQTLCFVFRMADGNWYIQKDYENLKSTGNEVVLLTQERFEALLRRALS